MIKRIELVQRIDECGEPEVFTWDLFPLVDASLTTHLDENGLAKKGTVVNPGMILVGKIGKSRSYDAARQPSALEIEGLGFPELSRRYGLMWRNGSLYASPDDTGVVEDAWLEEGTVTKAVVLIGK